MKTSRVTLLGLGLAALVMTVAPAQAQESAEDYPSRQVTMVVPFAPGGFPDVVGRIIAVNLQQQFGTNFIVENVPGAGTVAASDMVRNAEPDGYTLLVATDSQWGTTPNIYEVSPYDPQKDFAPISILATTPIYLAVKADLGVETLAELIELIKSKPGEFSYGTPGIASSHHFLMETFKSVAGLDIAHIPYRGGSQVAPALAAGEVQVAMTAYTNIAPFLADNSVKLLAISTPERSEKFPDVPTFAEAGVEGVQFTGSLGILAPAGTPDAILDKLNAAMLKAVQSPEAMDQLGNGGFMPQGGSREQFAQQMITDLEYYRVGVEIAQIEKQ